MNANAEFRLSGAKWTQYGSPPRSVFALPSLLLGLLATLCCNVQAAAGDLVVHGFGTVGVAYLDKPAEWAYARSQNQRVNNDSFRGDLDSLIGLQVNYKPSESLELVGQATAALLADARPADYLELAFLAWRPDADWSLRLGRVNLDAYMISDHRDVGFSYQFIRPPVEYYTRMPTSLDGADVTRMWTAGGAQWQTKLFLGHTSGGTGPRRMKLWPVAGLMVSRESEGLLLRVSALRGRALNNLVALDALMDGLQQIQQVPVPQVVADAAAMEATLTTRHLRTHYVAAGVAYDRHDWLLGAEINRSRAQHNPAISFTSGYVSIGRRFGALSAFIMQSATDRDSRAFQAPDWESQLTPLGPELAQQAQALANGAATAINSVAAHQSTTSLGARWDVTPRVSLKAQWDRIDVRRDGGALWRNSDGRAATAHVVAVAADFVF
jgi:hypothetical protein